MTRPAASRSQYIAMILVLLLVACRHSPRHGTTVPARSTSSEEPTTTLTATPNPSAKELSDRARALLVKSGLFLHLSPALPAHWPMRAGAPAELVWFAYKSQPLPTGIVTYQVAGPMSKITVSLPAGEPLLENLSDGIAQGKESENGPGGQALSQAEQVLLSVLNGQQTPESAHA